MAIDEGHKEALLYLGALTKEEIKDLEPYENEVAHKKTKEVSLLIDRSRMLRRYLLYFLIGAIGMFLVERYLVMPSKLKEYRDEKKSLQESEASLMNKVQELSDEYQIKVAELEKNQRQLESEIADYEVQLGGLMQKEKISQANKMVDEKDYIEAARILYSVVSSKLDEENKTKWELLKETVYPKAVDQLYNEGMTLYQRNDFVEASTFFETLLIYEPEANTARKALYYLGCSNMAVDNLSGAKRYFERVEAEYANTREAILAKQKLEEIAKNQ